MEFENNGGGAFSLSGSFLNFVGGSNGIFTSSSFATTISSGIKVSDGPLTLGGNGTGLVTLSGSSGNDYGGKGVTKSGTSAFLITQSISSPGTVTINGGTLAFSGTGNLASAYQLRGGVIAASGTFSRTVGTGTTSINFAAGSNGGFAAYGGALTVSTNLGTWGTTASSLTATSNLILGSSIADNVVTLSAALNLGTAARTIQLVDNANSANDSAAISGIISGTGGLNLTGAGNLALSGVNTYTGVTTIGSGVALSVATIGDGGVAGNLGQAASTATNLVLNGGTLRYTGATASTNRNFTLGAGTTSTIHVSTAATVLTMTGASATTTGSINKTGDGVLTLSAANTHTGGTVLTTGTLRATANAGALGNGTLTLSGGILDLVNDTGLAFGRNTTVTANTQINSRRTTAGAGVTHSLGTLAMGAQTLTIGTDATVSSGTAGVTFGATALSAAGATFTANASTLLTLGAITGTNTGFTVNGAGNVTINGVIGTTTGTLTKDGAGTLTLGAANTFTGLTTVSGGSLALSGSGSLAGAVNVAASGASLNISDLTASGTSVTALSGVSGSTVVLGGKALTVGLANTSTTFAGVISGSTGALIKTGTGTLTLGAANTFTGLTTVSGGSLALSGSGSLAGAVTVDASGASLDISGITASGTSLTALSGVTGSTVVLGSKALTVGSANTSTTFAGVISGSGSLIKSGTGTLTLSGANSYTGGTTVQAGALIIDGNSSGSSGNLSVQANGTLGGSGTVGGATTISGIHSPGNSPGIQTFTNGLTYDGGTLEWELYSNTATAGNRGSATIGWDGVDVTGGNLNFINPTTMSLVFNGTDSPSSSVDWTNALWGSNQKWLVYQVTGGSIQNFDNFSISQQNWTDSGGRSFYDFGGDASKFSLGVEGSNIYLNFTAIPEPSRAVLLLISALGLLLQRRRWV